MAAHTRRRMEIVEPNSGSLHFLYKTVFGRLLLKILTCRFVSVLGGAYMNSRFSRHRIEPFIKENSIDMSEYENKKFLSYNEFFTRKIKNGKRHICSNKNVLICPCDSKLTAYTIDENSMFNIKGSEYSVADLINNKTLADEYIGGICLIFRLAVDDYHRYCYIDNGTQDENVHIKGKFHTVQSIALSHCNIYKRNAREYTILHTDNFGDVIHVEVGALMVGKIKNKHGNRYAFSKGEEKGMFEFGGSTIVLLLKKSVAAVDEEFFINTHNGYETVVKYGEAIGKAIN